MTIGNIEKRVICNKDGIYTEKQIIKNIKDLFSFETRTLPLIENKSSFEEIKEKGIIKIKSLFSNLSLSVGKNRQIFLNKPQEYAFIRNFIKLLNVIHLGLTTKTPLILERKTRYCKSTAIKYLNHSKTELFTVLENEYNETIIIY